VEQAEIPVAKTETVVKNKDPLGFLNEIKEPFEDMWITTQEPSIWGWL
jgi:hypothetical protein